MGGSFPPSNLTKENEMRTILMIWVMVAAYRRYRARKNNA